MLIKIKAAASVLYVDYVAPNRKAIIGFVLAALTSFLARKGYGLPDDALNALQSLLEGFVVSVGVWLATNTKR